MQKGVLLVNLGTPNAPTTKAVRRYLTEFLSDPYVVDLPRWLWWPILHGITLRIRPKRTARLYQKIWTNTGSPLLVFSEKLKIALQEQLGTHIIELAMRYENPSIEDALASLRAKQIEELVVLPLYPQYNRATTGSTIAKINQVLQQLQWQPTLQLISGYADHLGYILALADSIKQHWRERPRGEKLLFSFHGAPKKMTDQGDPYYDQCIKTAQLTAEQLNLSAERWLVVFQSRFGVVKWLEPYCDQTLAKLAKSDCKSVDVICPGFAVDCLETLEEIAIRNKALFLQAGGERFQYISALNDNTVHINLLAKLIAQA